MTILKMLITRQQGSRATREIQESFPLFLCSFVALCYVFFFAFPIKAQDESGVYVTTLDFVSLREGPGLAFDRIDVLPPDTTLPAIGRSHNGEWLQVEYNGVHGWMIWRYLIWTGDPVQLPTDGIDPVPFARRYGALAVANRETPYYPRYTPLPEDRVGTMEIGTRVEVTGRFGTGRLIWLQFRFEDDDQYYWAGSWNFEIEGTSQPIPDAAAIAPFGRLVAQLNFGYSQTNSAYRTIGNIWRSIASGGSATCNFIPEQIEPVSFETADIEREPSFVPAARALQSATASTNHAIALFAQACAAIGAERLIAAEIVGTALDEIDSAEVNLVLIQAFLPELTNYDPSLNPDPLAEQLSADVPGLELEVPQPPSVPTIDLPIVPPPTNTPVNLPTLSVTIEQTPTSIPPTSTPGAPTPTMPPITTPTG